MSVQPYIFCSAIAVLEGLERKLVSPRANQDLVNLVESTREVIENLLRVPSPNVQTNSTQIGMRAEGDRLGIYYASNDVK